MHASPHQALDAYSSRAPLSFFAPDCLRLYVEHGFRCAAHARFKACACSADVGFLPSAGMRAKEALSCAASRRLRAPSSRWVRAPARRSGCRACCARWWWRWAAATRTTALQSSAPASPKASSTAHSSGAAHLRARAREIAHSTRHRHEHLGHLGPLEAPDFSADCALALYRSLDADNKLASRL